CMQAREFPPTF
nr:immunoglobulin light chain junction region [Macaca mulatta]